MAKVRALMQEAGIEFTPGSRPAPEALAKLRALALERGIELPAFFGGGDRATVGTPVTRTVYKLAGDNPKNYRPVPVTVKLGISDGTTTEVIEGLNEGDVLITSVSLSSGAVAAAPQGGGANNPFTGGSRGGFGGGGGGRGR